MPNGTILDLNVACLAMMMCLDSGGGKVTHTESATTQINVRRINTLAGSYLATEPTTDDLFSEIARELAASVWRVSL